MTPILVDSNIILDVATRDVSRYQTYFPGLDILLP